MCVDIPHASFATLVFLRAGSLAVSAGRSLRRDLVARAFRVRLPFRARLLFCGLPGRECAAQTGSCVAIRAKRSPPLRLAADALSCRSGATFARAPCPVARSPMEEVRLQARAKSVDGAPSASARWARGLKRPLPADTMHFAERNAAAGTSVAATRSVHAAQPRLWKPRQASGKPPPVTPQSAMDGQRALARTAAVKRRSTDRAAVAIQEDSQAGSTAATEAKPPGLVV
ncbi:hypothetical protein ERJ75_001036400 [Trypanosoma vivax]|nr:hypothetical protein ERJ75_001036400 [Trypanosoma vivax]